METLAQALQQVLAGTEDSLPHRAALFFLGFLPELSDPVTVITSGRRRARRFAERGLPFATHPDRRPREVQEIRFGPVLLPVATVEQTLVDLAGRTSDVALKRVLFWEGELARLTTAAPESLLIQAFPDRGGKGS